MRYLFFGRARARVLIRTALVSAALGAAACAATGGVDEQSEPAPEPGDGGRLIPDAKAPEDARVDADASFEPPVCSEAGWCRTPLPEADLWFKDIWPLSDRAFAIATSNTVGAKVLEWDADRQWTFIDDKRQVSNRITPSNVWASSKDEIFHTVADLSGYFGEGPFGAFVYRGARPVPPATTWSWTRYRFDCSRVDPSPRVWGTSSSDVYLATCGKILHFGGSDAGVDGGDASSWTEEYADDDPASPLAFQGVTGTGPDDIWFVGSRGNGACTVLVRKTAAGYQKIADATPGPDDSCEAKSGLPVITGAFRSGFHAPAKDRFVGVRYSLTVDNDIVKISSNGSDYDIDFASPAATMDVVLGPIWGAAEDDLWIIASRSNAGAVLRGASLWSDAGTYEYSTLALNGAPNTRTLECIRGTSNSNLWAVGHERAFHKTIP